MRSTNIVTSSKTRYKPSLEAVKRFLESRCTEKEKLQKVWNTVLLEMIIMYYPPVTGSEAELKPTMCDYGECLY